MIVWVQGNGRWDNIHGRRMLATGWSVRDERGFLGGALDTSTASGDRGHLTVPPSEKNS